MSDQDSEDGMPFPHVDAAYKNNKKINKHIFRVFLI